VSRKGSEVTVRPGDSLWLIAAHRLGPNASTAEIAAEWPRWYAANQAQIGPDPGELVPGQQLTAPATTPEVR
jgi:nucleoid-associated protein YgaU